MLPDEGKPRLQNYQVDTITVPASGQVEHSYGFQPDQVLVYSDDLLDTGVNILVGGAQGGGTIPLRGQGPAVFPGVQDNQVLTFFNLDTVARELLVIGQRGLLPTAITGPVVLSSAGEPAPTNMTRVGITTNNPIVFTHEHIGDGPLVVLAQLRSSIATARTVSTVTAGATSLTKKEERTAATTGTSPTSSVWYVASLAAGTYTITITCSGALANSQGWAISWGTGVAMGNTGGAGANATTIAPTVTGQYTKSVLLCLSGNNRYQGDYLVNETGGAIKLFDGADLGAGVWKQVGQGTRLFSLSTTQAGITAGLFEMFKA